MFKRAGIALAVLSLVVGSPVALRGVAAQSVQPAPDAATPALDSALARQKDAESLASLSAEGRLLYARERVKLDGYQYCSQAVSLAERGELRQSIRAASKALVLGERARDNNLVGSSFRDLAIAYSYAGNLDRAEEYARKALAQGAPDRNLIEAPANKVLGDVALRRGNAGQAIGQYRAALELASERYRPVVESSLANAYLTAGDLASARASYDRIQPPTDPAFRQIYLRGLGQLLLAEKQPAKAAEVFRSALESAAGADAPYHRLWAYEGMGRAYLALSDLPGAASAYSSAVAAADSVRARFRSEEFKSALFGDVQQMFERAMALSMQTGDHAAAFDVSEKSRSRALMDMIRERVADAPGATQARLSVALDSKRVREALRPNEALVQFHTVDDRLFAWVVRSGGVQGFEIPVDRRTLADRIERFRDGIVERRASALDDAAALHRLLIAPLGLRAGELLVFVPHGPLHYLPFQALRDDSGFLIERHAVAVAPSASIAIDTATRTPRPSKAPLVAFGNPATEAQYALPGSEREVQRIGALFGDSRIYLRAEASRKRFAETAGTGRILHVAAHAEADDVDPLFSRILLARDGDDPGFLEAREIYALDLSGVSLVTLSACESGLGSSPKGDEVLGFTRSFLTAGASSLVSSLWPVDDDSTEFLMTTMYAELAKGADLAAAMQTAQVASMKRPRFRHPFFWAPFAVMGDWRHQVGGR
jgi:CHAT domain-containing protein